MNKFFLLIGAGVVITSIAGCGESEQKTISSKETIKISTETQFPPMGFKEDGDLKGFDIDLGEALAKKMNINIDWRESQFSQFLTDITSNRSDAVIAGMVDMPERRENHTFVDFYKTGYQFFTFSDIAESKKILEIEDFCGLTVAASRNSSYSDAIEEWSNNNCVDSQIKVLDTDGSSNARLQLRQGRADGVMQTSETISYMASKDDKITPIGEPITSDYYGIIVSKDNVGLANRFADALEDIIEDGTYVNLLKKWGIEGQQIEEVTINLEKRQD